jgi:hypothetical protein
MDFQKILKLYSDLGCDRIYVKRLSPNDNSKNQVYLAGNFDVLNIFPIKEIYSDKTGKNQTEIFKAKIDYYWIDSDFGINSAPSAQLILYPQYPEVRFSGFLNKVKNAPSELMGNRIDGRILFLGVNPEGKIIGYVTGPDSDLTEQFYNQKDLSDYGVFKVITIKEGVVQFHEKEKLLIELKRIHLLGWIDSKRLDRDRNLLPCNSSNCGGYTLEAELGIIPNGYAEPDYLGYEIKQYSVNDFKKIDSSTVTLMTPEPNGGIYVDKGIESFIRKYGYEDKYGRPARLNFGGIHKFNQLTASTRLKLIIEGYDKTEKLIKRTDGYIGLIDQNDNIAASWSFAALLKHWNTKHANACYVPSKIKKFGNQEIRFSNQQYHFGNEVMIGSGTDFSFVLEQISNGNLYYDPGIKLELEIQGVRKQNIKRRSQFRMKSGNLTSLYKASEIINLLE